MKQFPSRFVSGLTLFAALLATGCAHSGVASKTYKITDYGAVAGGTTLNTAAIQKAIDTANSAGGGVVEVPAGTFLTGAIFLKPNVELHLDEGAVVMGSNNIEDYPKQETRIEGHFEPWRTALINAQGMTGVRITGKGQFNGNGRKFWRAFWETRRTNPRVTNLGVERPRLMFIDRCQDVRIEGVSLQDSGFWNLHLYRCRDVIIDGVRINAPSNPAPTANTNFDTDPFRGPSTDGIDIDSCQNVTVRKSQISCGDDNIALKGSKGPLADRDTNSPPVENIMVEDCEFGDGNGIITCGSEATTVRNVIVRNCTITGRTSVLTLKFRQDTPQHYYDITVDGIKLVGGQAQIINGAPWRQFFDLQGQPPPTRLIENITIRNVTGDGRAFGTLNGDTGDTLRNITLENININLTMPRLNLGRVENFVAKNVIINGEPYQAPGPQQ